VLVKDVPSTVNGDFHPGSRKYQNRKGAVERLATIPLGKVPTPTRNAPTQEYQTTICLDWGGQTLLSEKSGWKADEEIQPTHRVSGETNDYAHMMERDTHRISGEIQITGIRLLGEVSNASPRLLKEMKYPKKAIERVR
jgi:hypothetical protein